MGTFAGVPRGLSLALSGYFYMALDSNQGGEGSLRMHYYVGHPEIRTLEDFARFIQEVEGWK